MENGVDAGFCASTDKFYSPFGLITLGMGTFQFSSNTVSNDKIPRFRSVAEWQAYNAAHHDSPAKNPLIGSLAGVTNIWNDLDPRFGFIEEFQPILTNQIHAKWFPSVSLMNPTLFETREGTIGIMQITSFTENPRGVKIRYKLVQNGNSNQSEPSTNQSDIIHKLNEQLNGTKTKIVQQQAELEELSKLNNAQLRDVLPQMTKDSSLERLLQELDAAQLQLKILAATSNSSPNIKQVLLDNIADTNKKIDDRVSGLVLGLKAQVEAEKAASENLKSKLDQLQTPTNSETK
jgi:predicted transcriptional regulator